MTASRPKISGDGAHDKAVYSKELNRDYDNSYADCPI